MSESFRDKFNARKTQSVTTTPVSHQTPQSTTNVVTRTETVVQYRTNPFIGFVLAISLGINLVVSPLVYIGWSIIGSPEYAVWVARNRPNVVLDANTVRRHENYYQNVKKLLKESGK
jgi:hypothetical protein